MKFLNHSYGQNVFVLDSLSSQTWLSELCLEQTTQPRLNQLISHLYRQLLLTYIDLFFDSQPIQIKTRMATQHPKEGVFSLPLLSKSIQAISVNLARAGTWPSHICYDTLCDLLPSKNIRQDHIFAARISNHEDMVTGAHLGAHKIGGSQQDAYVLIPDPMGATGNTLSTTLSYYKNHVEGKAKSYIALHLIVTPEYLKLMQANHPDTLIFCHRVDRGLSPDLVLNSPLGKFWDQEKGLNPMGYIVPGAGGLGELLNNAYV